MSDESFGPWRGWFKNSQRSWGRRGLTPTQAGTTETGLGFGVIEESEPALLLRDLGRGRDFS